MLTGNATPQVAHIFPYSMFKSSPGPDSPYSFWNLLKSYWSDDRVQEWRDAIFSNQNDPTQGVETCRNLICLSPDAHTFWMKSYFALQPVRLSDDKKSLEVKFHWMPRRRNHNLDILSPPPLLEILDGIRLYDNPTDRPISSGDSIFLTTDDPENYPLPHYGLLEMQWILQRVAAMSGAADIYDDFDNDDDDPMALRNEWGQYEDEWGQYEEDGWDSYMGDDDWNSYEEESLPVQVNQPSPPSSPPSPRQPSLPPLQRSNIRFDHIPLRSADVRESTPPSSSPRQPSPSPLPKSNIRFDHIPLQPTENPDTMMIGSLQGQ